MLTPSKTNGAEKKELYTLGFLFAQMDWLTLISDDTNVREGANRAGITLDTQQENADAYDGIIYYKRRPIHKREGVTSVELSDFNHLTRFVSEAVKELYRRGIMR